MTTPLSPALDSWLKSGHYWTWQGHRIFVRTAGQGPALLLVHGYPSSSYDWSSVWDSLAQNFSLIAPDMLGLGFSDKPASGTYSLAAHARMHLDLLEHMGCKSAAVAAHDLGVSVLQTMLRMPRWGVEIGKVALLNGGACPDAYRPRVIQKLLVTPLGRWIGPLVSQSRFEQTIASLFGPQHPPNPALLQDMWSLFHRDGGRSIAHLTGRFWKDRQPDGELLVRALAEHKSRITFINGAADPNSGDHMAQALIRRVPKIRLVSLKGHGHWAQFEAPARVAAEIRAALQ